MSRQMRIEYNGAVYHVTSRGNEKKDIFYEDTDRYRFLDILADIVKRYNWICHSYCLMSNHYHLLIETPEGNLSQGMQQINGIYGMRFNREHSRVGHLFQGRFKAIIVDRENYLLELCRYIVLNPVRANIVSRPENYLWSSYRAIAGLAKPIDLLTVDWVLNQFGNTLPIARKKYIEHVYSGIGGPCPWDDLRGQIILGKERFIQTIEDLIGMNSNIPEIPIVQRNVLNEEQIALAINAKDVCDDSNRNKAIFDLHYKNGLRPGKIARIFSLHPSTISKIISDQKIKQGFGNL